MTEQQVLRKLDIPDFRHMTKEKVIKFGSMLSKMDPEVAKHALDQFPEYANLVGSIVTGYKDVAMKAFESNDLSMKQTGEFCMKIAETLQKQLEDENLTTDERATINGQLIELAHLSAEIDQANKNFILKVMGVTATTAVAIIGIAASLLGGNNKIGPGTDA